MQTNTVETRNRAVNFSNPSVEKEGHWSDPFTVKDGRYVGSDGFVVPKDFREFFERFPNYVRQWVSKHGGTSAPEEDLVGRDRSSLDARSAHARAKQPICNSLP